MHGPLPHPVQKEKQGQPHWNRPCQGDPLTSEVPSRAHLNEGRDHRPAGRVEVHLRRGPGQVHHLDRHPRRTGEVSKGGSRGTLMLEPTGVAHHCERLHPAVTM
jgi:hypothetical protein